MAIYTATGGYVVLRSVEAIGKRVYKLIKNHEGEKEEKTVNGVLEYTVIREGKSNENVKFLIGDKFRILGKDNDAVLIDKLGDSNSPYYVSAKLLSEISEYDENSKTVDE